MDGRNIIYCIIIYRIIIYCIMTEPQFFCTNIKNDTMNNTNFRKVIATFNNQQLVLMCIKSKDDIPFEIHEENDQFIRIEKGKGLALLGENKQRKCELNEGDIIMIPAGTWHQICNISDSDLKLYTIYSPPHHPPKRIDVKKPKEQDGGFYEKYLKYKYKYMNLKNHTEQ